MRWVKSFVIACARSLFYAVVKMLTHRGHHFQFVPILYIWRMDFHICVPLNKPSDICNRNCVPSLASWAHVCVYRREPEAPSVTCCQISFVYRGSYLRIGRLRFFNQLVGVSQGSALLKKRSSLTQLPATSQDKEVYMIVWKKICECGEQPKVLF